MAYQKCVHAVLFCMSVWLAPASPLAAQSAAFEVASVKLNTTEDFRATRMQVLPGGHFSATALPLRYLIVYAYNLPMNPSERLTGVPEWTNEARYDIEAKAPDGAFPAGMSANEARTKMRAMLQGLLVERFKLVMRRETKDASIYALTVANGGARLKASGMQEADCKSAPLDSTDCHVFTGGMGRGLHAKAVTMKDLAGYIENWTDHPVVDRTGLDGLFAIETEGWTMTQSTQVPAATALPAPAPRTGGGDVFDPLRPTLFVVLHRLGLDLKLQKGPTEIYVVDQVERPTGN